MNDISYRLKTDTLCIQRCRVNLFGCDTAIDEERSVFKKHILIILLYASFLTRFLIKTLHHMFLAVLNKRRGLLYEGSTKHFVYARNRLDCGETLN